LACLFVLIDCRHEPLKIDLEFIHRCGEMHIPIALVFTKTDKLSEGRLLQNTDRYKRELLKTWEILPQVFSASTVTRTGRTEILNFIDKTNRVFGSG